MCFIFFALRKAPANLTLITDARDRDRVLAELANLVRRGVGKNINRSACTLNQMTQLPLEPISSIGGKSIQVIGERSAGQVDEKTLTPIRHIADRPPIDGQRAGDRAIIRHCLEGYGL